MPPAPSSSDPLPPVSPPAPGAAPSGKRPGALRTIGEVAEDLDLPQHVLRFWEVRFPVLRPLKRAGGRRFYRPEDVDLLRGIRHLLHAQGYTIRGAQAVLRQGGVRFVQAIGRGQAQAGPPGETSGPGAAPDPAADGPDGPAPNPDALGDLLRRALHELRLCRDALHALRQEDDRDGLDGPHHPAGVEPDP